MVDDEMAVTSPDKAAVALKGFRYIMAQWACSEAEQRQLLGLSHQNFQRVLSADDTAMTEDVLRRISYLMGIARALHALYPTEDRAAQRIRKPTTDEPFCGLSPLALMLADSLEGARRTRRYFDWIAQV